ncbi:DHH family phosphoesterase [Candidatus Saccharibacteria bacterium]|nr:DHH family phosphoesterase [Candidatus Saccharibacteria bacterium]
MNTDKIYPQGAKIVQIIDEAQHIVIIQADNPDGDSLASALALEQILGEQGKKVTLYCGINISSYLHYIPGHDRVVKDMPNDFDTAILVDCSSVSLLEQLHKTNQFGALRTKPFIIIDHHQVTNDIPITSVELVDTQAVATGEVIYRLAKQLTWTLDKTSANLLATSIMADSLGLTIEAVTSQSIHCVAELVDLGANLAQLEAVRRLSMTKTLDIIAYKGRLLQRIEYFCDNKLALVTIPWDEIEKFSPLYNPAVLALEELRFAEGVQLAVAIKLYPDGKITGKLRCNYGTKIAGSIAEHFGGDGHSSAAGFKTKKWQFDDLKNELIKKSTELLINNPEI